jgi:hypothetical protein
MCEVLQKTIETNKKFGMKSPLMISVSGIFQWKFMQTWIFILFLSFFSSSLLRNFLREIVKNLHFSVMIVDMCMKNIEKHPPLYSHT